MRRDLAKQLLSIRQEVAVQQEEIGARTESKVEQLSQQLQLALEAIGQVDRHVINVSAETKALGQQLDQLAKREEVSKAEHAAARHLQQQSVDAMGTQVDDCRRICSRVSEQLDTLSAHISSQATFNEKLDFLSTQFTAQFAAHFATQFSSLKGLDAMCEAATAVQVPAEAAAAASGGGATPVAAASSGAKHSSAAAAAAATAANSKEKDALRAMLGSACSPGASVYSPSASVEPESTWRMQQAQQLQQQQAAQAAAGASPPPAAPSQQQQQILEATSSMEACRLHEVLEGASSQAPSPAAAPGRCEDSLL